MIQVLVICRWGFYNVLYSGLPLKSAQKMQLVQNTVTRLRIGASYWEDVTLIVQHL